MRFVLDQTLHIIPPEVLDAPPRICDNLPTVSFGEMAASLDRAGFSMSMSALRRVAEKMPQTLTKQNASKTQGSKRSAAGETLAPARDIPATSSPALAAS